MPKVIRPKRSAVRAGAIDNYILSKLKRLSRIVKQGLDTYDVALSCNEVASFMEILNNWYIRRTRDRFWSGDQQAFDVLYTGLVNLSKIMAPLMPFLCEYVYRTLTGGEASIWPITRSLKTLSWTKRWLTKWTFCRTYVQPASLSARRKTSATVCLWPV